MEMLYKLWLLIILAGIGYGMYQDQTNAFMQRVPAALKRIKERLKRMINSDYKNKKGMTIQGTLPEVSAECILIMRAIYNKNKEELGDTVAKGILVNMLTKAVFDKVVPEPVTWEISEEEKMAYTD